MKMKKQVLILFCTFMLLFVLLTIAACGSTNSDTSAGMDNPANSFNIPVIGDSGGVQKDIRTNNVVCQEFELTNKFILPINQETTIPSGYIGISAAEEFCKVGLNPAKNYILMADIDLSGVEFKSITGFFWYL